ncbi:MAG: hypothetical protein M1828_006954 [Chrysothrix sp. TS-e1954]|nr:MAG: hypothetical protein M1828_006954 [Chrysothrix sp. TS-e1954]
MIAFPSLAGACIALGALVVGQKSTGQTSSSCPDFNDYSQAKHAPFSTGRYNLSDMRPSPQCRTYSVPGVDETVMRYKNVIKDPDLYRLFQNAYPNTLDTAVRWKGAAANNSAEELAFIITGDINAMWLRDSANQLQSYKPLLNASTSKTSLASLYRGVINLQSRYVQTSPYCQSFQPPVEAGIPPAVNGAADDDTVTPTYSNSSVFECKFELDSFAAFLEVSTDYYNRTNDAAFFSKFQWVSAVQTIMNVAEAMMQPTYASNGSVNVSPYTYERMTTSGEGTLDNSGVGNPVGAGTGLIRSPFRPSDDAAIYQLFIPANAMFSRYLASGAKIMATIPGQKALATKMTDMSNSLKQAIEAHGIVSTVRFGNVYAYEIDGFASRNLMDDANIPSLLSLPFLGYVDVNDKVYQNTRDYVLSTSDPYFTRGPVISGIGGPHDGPGYAWPMASIVRIFTSNNKTEIQGQLKELEFIALKSIGPDHEAQASLFSEPSTLAPGHLKTSETRLPLLHDRKIRFPWRPKANAHRPDNQRTPELRLPFLHERKVKIPRIHKGEQAKSVYRKNRLLALVQILIHVPAVTASVIILSFNYESYFAQEPGPDTNTLLDTLQFASKAHESLLIFSISVIVLYYTRFFLIGSTGVPLGLLSGSYQAHSVLNLLLPSFWGAAFSNSHQALRHWRLVTLILIASILAFLAGPSSAVAMIPRLDWYSLDDPSRVGREREPVRAFAGASPHGLFPQVIDSSFVSSECFNKNAWTKQSCPSAGFAELLASGSQRPVQEAPMSLQSQSVNVSMSVANSLASRFLAMSNSLDNPDGTAFQYSTPPAFLASLLDLYWLNLENELENPKISLSYRQDESVQDLQIPLVSVECTWGSGDEPLVALTDKGEVWSVPVSALGKASQMPTEGVFFDWISRDNITQDPRASLPPSLTAAFSAHNGFRYACLANAVWMNSQLWLEPNEDQVFRSNFDNANTAQRGPAHQSPFLDLQLSWARALNVPFSSGNDNRTESGMSTVEKLASFCSERQGKDQAPGSALSRCLGDTLGLVIADGLARLHSSMPQYLLMGEGKVHALDQILSSLTSYEWNTQDNIGGLANVTLQDLTSNPSQYTEYAFKLERYGYGWSFNRQPIYLASIVLLLHILFVLLHLIHAIYQGMSSTAWMSPGELLALALNSSPSSALRNTGAGVSKNKTWRSGVRVLENTTDDGKLELVVDDGRGDEDADEKAQRWTRRPRAGKKYS